MISLKTSFKRIQFALFLFILPICLFSANISINTTQGLAPISPYIYGTNDDSFGDSSDFTCMRMGGNRLTGYNWENNASNAGTDYGPDSSDSYMCPPNPPVTNCAGTPGATYQYFVSTNNSKGYASLVTIPMAGYVAADMNGDVTAAQTAPSSRWHPIYYTKGSPFTYPPNTTDDAVYMDESVWYLVQTFGNASTSTGVKFYDLDNEPGIWNGTHPYLHPNHVTCNEYVNDSIALGGAIKNVDPYCMIFGGVFFGWSDYINLNGAPDWTTALNTNYIWFVSYYLYMMNQSYQATGKKPIDVLDFHYYSEATDGTCRVTDNGCSTYLTAANDVARMNATRTLWETGYAENSWINPYFLQYTPLIPLIQQSINQYFPGTKISFSEWNFGAGREFSGGLTDTDFLGICGKYGVYLATLWPVDEGGYSAAAFKMYRNYDGAKSTFGNTNIQADSDTSTISVYASINGSDLSTIHMIIVNKYNTAQPANITITSSQTYTTMQVYGFDQTSYTITARSTVAINNNYFSYNMPAYSAMHFIIKSNTTPTNTPVVSITQTTTFTLTKTITPPWTQTPTYTRSATYTITPTFTVTPALVATIIYDGDTAGATLSDGTVNNTAPGTMTQVTGGDLGNMMLLTYTNVAGYWQQLWWTLNNPKNIGTNLYLTFNMKEDASSPNPVGQMYLTADTNWAINVDPAAYIVGGGTLSTTTWSTVRIPLSAVIDAGQTQITFLAFTASVASTDNFTVDIDNIRLEGYPGTPTNTPVYSRTLTQTFTVTRTTTLTNTVAMTLTNTPKNTMTLTTTETSTLTTTGTSTTTRTNTPTYTITTTLTNTPSSTPTNTMTATPTETEIVSPTPTITGTPPTETDTPTITMTTTLTETYTFTCTLTITPSYTITMTYTVVILSVTYTPTYTMTPTDTATPTYTGTYTYTFTPTYKYSVTLTYTNTLTPTYSNTVTLTYTITKTPTTSLTITRTYTITLTYTATPNVSPTFSMTCPCIIPTITPGITVINVWPNPYNPNLGNLSIGYTIAQDTDEVDIRIYTIAFRLIKVIIVSGSDSASSDEKTETVDKANFSNLADGTYYYILTAKQAGKQVKSKTGVIIILK